MWHCRRVLGGRRVQQQFIQDSRVHGSPGGVLAVAAGTLAVQLLGVGLAVSTVGCSDLAPSEDSYANTTTSQRPLTGPPPPEWACLDAPPKAEVPMAATYTFTGSVFDYRSQRPLTGATLRACSVFDVPCESSLGNGLGEGDFSGPPIAPGIPSVRVVLPAQFTGFLRLTAPPNYVTYDYYIGGPMTKDAVSTQPFTMLTQSSFVEFATGLGVSPAEAAVQGSLAVQILNCLEDPAQDVDLVLSDADRPDLATSDKVVWAAQNLIPVRGQTTDASGVAGFIKLPTVNLNVEAVVTLSSGETRHFGKRGFQIVAGRLTTGTMRPYYLNGL
jgi:hypothetical protein